MKIRVLVLALTFAAFFNMACGQNQVVKDSLSTSLFVSLNERVSYGSYEVKFKKIITDSRCPKNVMCVRAGEADILVSIFNKGKFIKTKRIRIDASGYVMEANNLAYDGVDFKIYGYNLTPYPKGVEDIREADYKLEIVFQPKILE